MLARLIATFAALLLTCAQVSAHVRTERAADLGTFAAGTEHALKIERSAVTASPGAPAQKPKTAPPARARLPEAASAKNVALSHCRIGENWTPLQDCASMPGVYQWDGTRLAGRTNATGTSLDLRVRSSMTSSRSWRAA